MNDACVLLGKPNAYGSIFRFDGQASVFAVKGGPCYRCLYPEPPPPGLVPSCAEGGVLGVLPGVIGVIQATEAIKLILGAGQPLVGRLLLYDALQMRFRELKLRRDPECPMCGDHPTINGAHRLRPVLRRGAGRRARAAVGWRRARDHGRGAEGARSIAARTSYLLDVREPNEFQICRIAGSDADPARRAVDGARRSWIRDRDIVVHCKMGGRSAKAVALLQERGFTRARNLKGGILAWIDRVDPSQSRVLTHPRVAARGWRLAPTSSARAADAPTGRRRRGPSDRFAASAAGDRVLPAPARRCPARAK